MPSGAARGRFGLVVRPWRAHRALFRQTCRQPLACGSREGRIGMVAAGARVGYAFGGGVRSHGRPCASLLRPPD